MVVSSVKVMLNKPMGMRFRAHRFRNSFFVLTALAAIFAPTIFFSVSGLVGFEYGGAEESPVYVRFIVLTFALVLIALVFSYMKKPRLSGAEISFYLFFFLLIINHLVWALFDNAGTQLWPANLILFFSMGVTGFMAARVIHAYDLWEEVIKVTEVLMLIMAIGLIVAIVQPFLMGLRVRGIGGASYQAASYYAAMCYGMIGLATFRLPKEWRFRFLCNRIVALVNMAIMAALFVAALVNGGRGAFVLLVVYTGIIVYWKATKGGWTWSGVFRFMAVVLTVPILLSIALQKVFNDPILAAGWGRAVAFIGSADGGLIDLEGGSSGRDRVYAVALRGIVESPWIGHGGFSHWEKVIQPHNLFLDLALQFGIPVAFLIIVSVSIALLFKLRNFPNLRVEQLWLLMLFIYPMVNLMVSGGYFKTAMFWFCLISIFPPSKNYKFQQPAGTKLKTRHITESP